MGKTRTKGKSQKTTKTSVLTSDGHHRFLKPSICPLCGYTLDAATNADSGDKIAPKPGDVTVCFGCAGILEFTEDMGVRLADVATLEPDHRAFVYRVVKLIKEMKSFFKSPFDSGVAN